MCMFELLRDSGCQIEMSRLLIIDKISWIEDVLVQIRWWYHLQSGHKVQNEKPLNRRWTKKASLFSSNKMVRGERCGARGHGRCVRLVLTQCRLECSAGASSAVVASRTCRRVWLREIFGAVTGRGLPGIGYLSHSYDGRRRRTARSPPRSATAAIQVSIPARPLCSMH